MSIPPNATLFLGNVEKKVKGLIEPASEANEREIERLATRGMIVAPIGKLPTKLLVEISSIWCIPPSSKTWTSRSPRLSPDAVDEVIIAARSALPKVLCLSQVSPWWRQIVHNTPQLWAEGVIDVKLEWKENEDAYLRRARIMLTTAQRWRNLIIHLVCFSYFDGLAPGTFEALEWLHIRDLSHQTMPVTAFQSSPHLRTVTLDTLSDSRHSVHPTTGILERQRCSRRLSSFLSSKILIVSLNGRLALTNETGGTEAFFLPLALPSLQILDLDIDLKTEDYWPTEVFAQFQTRSPNIESLSLYNSEIEEDLVDLLHHTPALTALNITYCWNCIRDDFLDALIYDADSVPLVPRLQDICLEYTLPGGFEESLLEDALRSG
ncbi:hypothetical protein DFH09DRAFT_1284780 [Mycena vulgaris]|nr:hypothetical protein DFH09DRAFT_1284780 [Mycena vulgaris]